jgi:hypothetical protein
MLWCVLYEQSSRVPTHRHYWSYWSSLMSIHHRFTGHLLPSHLIPNILQIPFDMHKHVYNHTLLTPKGFWYNWKSSSTMHYKPVSEDTQHWNLNQGNTWTVAPLVSETDIAWRVRLSSRQKKKKNSVAWIGKRTIPSELKPLVGEVSANNFG